MALPDIVVGSNHTALTITWQRKTTAAAVVITGATITARMTNKDPHVSPATRNVTGILAVTVGASGIFTWTFSAADVATPGDFDVYFIATFADTTVEKTYADTLRILPAK